MGHTSTSFIPEGEKGKDRFWIGGETFQDMSSQPLIGLERKRMEERERNNKRKSF